MSTRTEPDPITRSEPPGEGERPSSDRPAPGGPHDPHGRDRAQPVDERWPDDVPDEERLVDDPSERRRPDQPAGADPMVGEAPTG